MIILKIILLPPVWCRSDYVLSDDINWAPSDFELTIFTVSFKRSVRTQISEAEGGIKLYPEIGNKQM